MKYEVRKSNDELIFSSSSMSIRRDYSRNFQHEGVEYLIYLEVENNDEKKAVAVRKRFFDILENVSKNFINEQRNRFNKYNHIIQTISTQILQKMDGFWENKKWHSSVYSEALKNIENISSYKKNETNKLIHYFNKMSLDLKSHIEGWDIIYIKDNYVPKYEEVSLRKAILNQYSSFAEDFNELGIQIRFSEYFSEDYTVDLDKKLFSLIMYNFFSNILKYAKPGEEVRFNYLDEEKKLDISMYSIKIERCEIKKLFDDGERGKNANKASSSGSGFGLYVIKKALRLMEMPNMYIDPQNSKSKPLDSIPYYENHFKFELKPETN
ncbi:TPA: hypothetical protein DEP58_03460 [Patescibacteria group bacterium]|nr:MAG: Sensor histidine kinase [Parcubacteria group bacterium GW2011_GWD2_42_14]HCC05337.1 hypothetical protein [Patescibacteria group bacterium]